MCGIAIRQEDSFSIVLFNFVVDKIIGDSLLADSENKICDNNKGIQ